MSGTLTFPDSVYERLEAVARDRGLESIEQLLEQWPLHSGEPSPLSAEELRQRQELVDEIDAIREEALTVCGIMAGCGGLIREDRTR